MGFCSCEQHPLVIGGLAQSAHGGPMGMGLGQGAFKPVQVGGRQVAQSLQRTGLVKAPMAIDHQQGLRAQGIAQRQHAVHPMVNFGLALGRATQGRCEAIKGGGFEALKALSASAQSGVHKTLGAAVGGGAVDVGVQRHHLALHRAQQAVRSASSMLRLQAQHGLQKSADHGVAHQAAWRSGGRAHLLLGLVQVQPLPIAAPLLAHGVEHRLPAVQGTLSPAHGTAAVGHRQKPPIGFVRDVQHMAINAGDGGHAGSLVA